MAIPAHIKEKSDGEQEVKEDARDGDRDQGKSGETP